MSDTSTPAPDFADRPPWTKPGFIAAAVLLALVIVAGAAIALWPSPSTQRATPPQASAVPDRGGGTVQPTPTGALPTAIPTVAPPDITWQLLGQVAVPVSKSAGPYRVSATASGFARTPTGALIAAAQVSARAGHETGRVSWEPTITQQFVPSPDRDKLLAALRSAPEARVEPGELSQTAGFRFTAYSADTAVIGLVDHAPGGTNVYYMTTLTLVWRDGDWRMVAPPGGQWTSINQRIADLAGVIEWGAR